MKGTFTKLYFEFHSKNSDHVILLIKKEKKISVREIPFPMEWIPNFSTWQYFAWNRLLKDT